MTMSMSQFWRALCWCEKLKCRKRWKKRKEKKNGQAGKGEESCPRVGLGQGGRYIWQRRSKSSGDECGRSNKEEEEEVRKCKEGGGERAK